MSARVGTVTVTVVLQLCRLLCVVTVDHLAATARFLVGLAGERTTGFQPGASP